MKQFKLKMDTVSVTLNVYFIWGKRGMVIIFWNKYMFRIKKEGIYELRILLNINMGLEFSLARDTLIFEIAEIKIFCK